MAPAPTDHDTLAPAADATRDLGLEDSGHTMSDVLGTLVPGAGRTLADQTIRPGPAPLTTLHSPALGDLAEAAVSLHRAIDLGDSLGSGGMGVVRSGWQRALRRPVAVKSMQPSAEADTARRALLQEAWAAAALEHPNIVPVYALAVDRFGEPHVIMRRVSGRTWSEYIADPDAIGADFGVRDPLGWHLSVLLQVCNALHYAHSQGVLHRDLKPDNVMIGRFGEVLVLDWGLAVRLHEGGPSELPLARDVDRVVGTPRYMAPEMARAEGPELSARTDVYLLGGLLYAALCGDGPHRGTTVEETLRGIPTFRPRLPPGASRRLESILARSMAHDPADRFESADALRLAVQRYLEERSAEGLARQAEAELEELLTLLAGEEPDKERVYRRFGAARFGFEEALAAWPESREARQGMRRALIAIADFELDLGLPSSAGRRLAELDDPPPELVERQRLLAARMAGADAELERLRRDQDPRVGQRTRVFVIVLFTLAWTAIPLWTWLRGDPVTYRGMMLTQGVMLALTVGLVAWARDSMTRTSLNRRIAVTLVSLEVAILATNVVGILGGAPAEPVASVQKLMSMMATLLLVDAVGPVVLLPAAGFFVAAIAGAWVPAVLLPANAATSLLVAVAAWVVWGRRLPPRPR